MLLSKRAEMFLPDYWPAYYSKAKDCFIWDLDGKKFVDMSLMGAVQIFWGMQIQKLIKKLRFLCWMVICQL